jgi:hypothetical protein
MSRLLVLSAIFIVACDRSSPAKPDQPGSATEPRRPEIVSSDKAHPNNNASSPHASPQSAKEPVDSHPTTWVPPPQGGPLLAEDAHRLLAGTVIFNPKSIPSSNTPVELDTPLDLGQDLQIKWGGTWWAGSILGFEPDGRVRIHYFGWASSYDELKSRSELQLDRTARVRALESTYVRTGW